MSLHTQQPVSPPQTYLVGRRRHWVRDLGLIGAVTGFAAPTACGLVFSLGLIGVFVAFGLLAGLIGGVLGLALGLVAPPTLEALRTRVPLPALWLAGFPIGAVWGGLTGYLAALPIHVGTAPEAATMAAMAGAMQLGLFWLPYTVMKVTGRSAWPVVGGALLASPLLGLASSFAPSVLFGH